MKRRCILLIAVTAISSFAANAQVNSLPVIGNRFTFGIDGGLALPGSDYGTSAPSGSPSSSSYNNSMDGYAKSGSYFDAYAGIKLVKPLGIMLQYGINMNSYNAAGLNDEFGTATANGGYKVNEYLVGPYLSLSLLKIKIEAKVLVGMVAANYPTTTFTYNGLMNTYGLVLTDAFQNGTGFGYCAGAKIKYMLLGGMLGIGVGMNYVGSAVSYKGTETGLSTTPTSFSSKMQISILQPTIGISLDI